MATRLKGEGRAGGVVVSMGKDGLKYSETYEFLVETDSKNTGRATVLLTAGLPILYVSVSVGGPAVCDQLTADRDPINPYWWRVKANFSSDISEGGDGSKDPANAGQSVTAWQSKGKIRFERYEEIMTKDVNDKEYVNSAKQPFETGLPIPRTIACIDFAQFEDGGITLETIMDRNGVINSDSFRGRDEKTFLLTVQSAERGFYYGQSAWLIYYSLKYKRDNWIKKQLNIGSMYLDSGTLKPFESNGARFIGGLNSSGNKVSAGTAPSVEEFEQFEAIAFTGLLRVV